MPSAAPASKLPTSLPPSELCIQGPQPHRPSHPARCPTTKRVAATRPPACLPARLLHTQETCLPAQCSQSRQGQAQSWQEKENDTKGEREKGNRAAAQGACGCGFWGPPSALPRPHTCRKLKEAMVITPRLLHRMASVGVPCLLRTQRAAHAAGGVGVRAGCVPACQCAGGRTGAPGQCKQVECALL